MNDDPNLTWRADPTLTLWFGMLLGASGPMLGIVTFILWSAYR